MWEPSYPGARCCQVGVRLPPWTRRTVAEEGTPRDRWGDTGIKLYTVSWCLDVECRYRSVVRGVCNVYWLANSAILGEVDTKLRGYIWFLTISTP